MIAYTEFVSRLPSKKGCSLGLPYILYVICLFLISVISHFRFEGRTLILINQFLIDQLLIVAHYNLDEGSAQR